MASPILRVFLIRHGITLDNDLIQGQSDTILSPFGRLQGQKLGKALATVPFQYAVSSDLSRCTNTARAILHQQSQLAVPLRLQPRLRSKSAGALEGQPKAKIPKPEVWRALEPADDFYARLKLFWKGEILPLKTSVADGPTDVLVVTHGECVPRGKNANGSISVVEVPASGPGVIVAYSDIRHLQNMS